MEIETQDEWILQNVFLKRELDFLKKYIEEQAANYAENPDGFMPDIAFLPPLDSEGSMYEAHFSTIPISDMPIIHFAARFIVILALAAEISPQSLDRLLSKSSNGLDYTEYGLYKKASEMQVGFVPTVQTALFLLAGNNIQMRLEIAQFFNKKSPFHFLGVLDSEAFSDANPVQKQLRLSREWYLKLTTGDEWFPSMDENFPAQVLESEMEWEDLVLPPHTLEAVNEISLWLAHADFLKQDEHLSKRMKRGYRALFHGSPGSGKTLTATLLGKKFKQPVFRIDLSMTVSKYIGETEKNLSKLFDMAQNRNWILFFDEADALFGKRTQVQSSHDRYANQEVSYLLQRMEEYEGLVILASNFKNNIDKAFLRRFQSIISFPLPAYQERLILWQKAFSPRLPLDKEIVLDSIAQKYELTGAHIVNIVQTASLHALANNEKHISGKILHQAIVKEYLKEEKVIKSD